MEFERWCIKILLSIWLCTLTFFLNCRLHYVSFFIILIVCFTNLSVDCYLINTHSKVLKTPYYNHKFSLYFTIAFYLKLTKKYIASFNYCGFFLPNIWHLLCKKSDPLQVRWKADTNFENSSTKELTMDNL